MKRNYLLIIALLFSTLIQGQGTVEAGLFAGLSNYGGDLVETDLEITETNPAIGIIARYDFKPWFTLRGTLMAGSLSGSDVNAENIGRRKRNLSFRSPVYEFSIIPEFNIYSFKLKAGQAITPYVFIGGGVFYYNPKALYEGEWIDLQPLGTEGQGLPGYAAKYNLIDFSIPFGMGLKFKVSEKATIGLEYGVRYTFTDYLDDVSTVYPDNEILAATSGERSAILSDRTSEYTGIPTVRAEDAIRGNPENPDVYYFFGTTVTINLFTPKVVEKPVK